MEEHIHGGGLFDDVLCAGGRACWPQERKALSCSAWARCCITIKDSRPAPGPDGLDAQAWVVDVEKRGVAVAEWLKG